MLEYEVCSEDYLEKLEVVEPEKLSLDDDMFHVIGRIYFSIYINNLHIYKSFKQTQDVYNLIKEKGGRYIKSEDSSNITCVIVGDRPSMRAIKMYEGKVKLVDAMAFSRWLAQQETVNQSCRVFEKSFLSSEDTQLRPYQQRLKNNVFRLWNSFYNIMLQLPTGTGKTVLFTSIINDLTRVKDTKIVILAHRKELIDQISEHLSQYQIEHGIIASGRIRRPEMSVQVASVQTLTHEKNIDLLKELKPKFIIIDEAHHSLADTYTKFWSQCGDCWKLGVTATPYRLNNKTFRSHFDKFVESDNIDDFISQGYLAEYEFLVDNPRSSLSQTIKAIKEKSSTGDYKTATLMKELNIEEHIQRLIVCYEQYVKGKKGIVYAINKEHAHNICQAYQVIGVNAVYIDSDTPKSERKETVERFRNNEIQVMVNVDIFSEGFDCPDVEFIQLARPTWSLAKYMQQVGRGLRPSENKQNTIILDNSRMFVKFGLPSESRNWKWHFTGDEQAKNLYKQENVSRENDLMFVSKYCDEMMVRMDEEGYRKALILKKEEDQRAAARLKAAIEEERRIREERLRQQEEAERKEKEEKRRQQEEAERRFAEAKVAEEEKRRQREEHLSELNLVEQMQAEIDALKRKNAQLRAENNKQNLYLKEKKEENVEKSEPRRVRRQKVDVMKLYGGPAIQVEHKNDHSDRNRKIFAIIATVVVFLILLKTVGFLGIAVLGLIAGGLSKR